MVNPFTKKHLWVFLGLLPAAAVLNYFVVNAGIDKGPEHQRQVIATTLATIPGPMTGAVARDFQGCCTRFLLWVLLIFSGPGLFIGVLVQVTPLPFKREQV